MKRDLLLAAALFGLAGFVWVETASYPRPSGDTMIEGLGPAFYPRLVAVAMSVLGGLVALAAVLGARRAGPVAEDAGSRAGRLRGGALLAVLVLYWWLMPVLGFPLASFLAACTAMALLAPPGVLPRRSGLAIMVVVAGVSAAAIYLVFARLVNVALPVGPLFGD